MSPPSAQILAQAHRATRRDDRIRLLAKAFALGVRPSPSKLTLAWRTTLPDFAAIWRRAVRNAARKSQVVVVHRNPGCGGPSPRSTWKAAIVTDEQDT